VAALGRDIARHCVSRRPRRGIQDCISFDMRKNNTCNCILGHNYPCWCMSVQGAMPSCRQILLGEAGKNTSGGILTPERKKKKLSSCAHSMFLSPMFCSWLSSAPWIFIDLCQLSKVNSSSVHPASWGRTTRSWNSCWLSMVPQGSPPIHQNKHNDPAMNLENSFSF
jgi:hypothetical protein